MIVRSDVDKCKSVIEGLIGKRVRLTSNGGRKRLIIRDGIVENCYPNLFTVKCKCPATNSEETVSFTYVDILTKTVRVAVPAVSENEAAAV